MAISNSEQFSLVYSPWQLFDAMSATEMNSADTSTPLHHDERTHCHGSATAVALWARRQCMTCTVPFRLFTFQLFIVLVPFNHEIGKAYQRRDDKNTHPPFCAWRHLSMHPKDGTLAAPSPPRCTTHFYRSEKLMSSSRSCSTISLSMDCHMTAMPCIRTYMECNVRTVWVAVHVQQWTMNSEQK